MERIICFHNPDEENGYLSNWYLSGFSFVYLRFSSIEQYMMYQKAMAFGDNDAAGRILSTADVSEIKRLGRSVSNYNDLVWNGIRQIVVYRGLQLKFNQNEELGKLLKQTGNAILAECAVNDCIWGIGLSMKDPKRLDPESWITMLS